MQRGESTFNPRNFGEIIGLYICNAMQPWERAKTVHSNGLHRCQQKWEGSVDYGCVHKNGMLKKRVAPDTDLARYPATEYSANNFAGYRISGQAGYPAKYKFNSIRKKLLYF